MADQQNKQEPSGFKKVALGCAWVLLVLIVLAALGGVWAARKYQQMAQFPKQAEQQISQLAQQFPFTPPASASSIGRERWEQMLAVRRSTLESLDQDFRGKVEQLLSMNASQGDAQMLWELWPVIQSARAVFEQHMKSLRENGMSLEEFSWLLGLAMREAIKNPEQYEAGRQYLELLSKVITLVSSHPDFKDQIKLEDVLAGLDEQYGAAKMDASWVVRELDDLQVADHLADLICLGYQFQ